MKSFTLVLCAFMFLLSCEKDAFKLEKDQYLVFGTYNGYCQGNCTWLYKIDHKRLFADDMSTFVPGEDLKFEENALSKEKYDMAYEAFDKLPEELQETMDVSFGCPGCVDQDIIYLEYFDGADLYEWVVDTEKDALPKYLQEYAGKILEVVQELLK